ncbi:imidazole glycerol phosphate synthase subunit HisH [Fredinandcohnia quinoae]|uniref:Imidazole glycerol phosphate synthase subunit HisH n=1 Tax=Fredinandcohnia quinoae TaxID=2918902 RepID=A0AAW5E4P7_9BACI|nr:imidazole glycerol phosphate synthase subunit HisH [Fredinandcohnia sp. SECRCQ15]MCH1625789.1 imidazole glycerol phosphate synthase subunit HisH [Fredinandcohnia sp. SECRCQ15]
MIGIIDYGMGNLYSVSKALERMNQEHIVSKDQSELEKTSGLILPGVGSFKDAMQILRETGLDTLLKESIRTGKPLLGICLGMQLLFEQSEENGVTSGLGFLNGRIIKIPSITSRGETYKVPHMGWNELKTYHNSRLLNQIEKGHVYFVHSYYAEPSDNDIVLASCTYNVEVPAVVGCGNVFGTQFHPEKSGETGLAILKNFAAIVEECVKG